MRIIYIGSGFVGACSAAVAAGSGHDTLVYDIDQNKIDLLSSGDRARIESCLFEEGLSDLLVRNSERIHFTTNYSKVKEYLAAAAAVFLCLPTPEIAETGESNMSYYWAACEVLAKAMAERAQGAQSNHITIINKSTVPIGTARTIEDFFKNQGVKNFGIAANPEFLVEGKAILGSLKPDRIVVGASAPEDFAILRGIYQRFTDSPTTEYLEVTPSEAEAGKLLANFYLFNRLAVCFDVIGRTAETFKDIKFESLRRILTSDPRIGGWGFYDSLYAGGSCFIKDSRSLATQFEKNGAASPLVQNTYQANERQLEQFLKRANTEANFSFQGQTITILGVAFKRDTNDVRHSPAFKIVSRLGDEGVAKINIYDPAAAAYFKAALEGNNKLNFFDSAEEAMESASAIIIATDWPQFRGLADVLLSPKFTARPLIMDGRRMLQHRYQDLESAGFSIIAVGSPFIRALQ
ncbi:MAG: nucleotide sugar dehydrogenase [Candidatus Magasanikbacteria bacterium]|nr:nucleotide sugar dehydrogenase [Candidatus Magasanikbacteria bacterium]